MRQTISRGLVVACITLASGVGLAGNRVHVPPTRQSAIVTFAHTTQVDGHTLSAGEYLILHDFERMDRGEPCTTLYAIGESDVGRRQELVTFHCIPRAGRTVSKATLTFQEPAGTPIDCMSTRAGVVDKLTAYQFADDWEIHGVPERVEGVPMGHDH
jgi:hypothetical protein